MVAAVDWVVVSGSVVVATALVADIAGAPIVFVLLHPATAAKANATPANRLVSMAPTVVLGLAPGPDTSRGRATRETRR